MFMTSILTSSTLSNLDTVLGLTAMFVLVWSANFCFSLYHNLVQIQENFEWRRCYQGLLKAVAILAGLLMITVVISALPTILSTAGIAIPDSVGKFISMTIILTPYALAIIYYLKDASETFIKMLGNKVVEFINDIESEEITEGMSLDTSEEGIESMDIEEPNVIEGQIGVEE